MQSLSNHQWCYSQNQNKTKQNLNIYMETLKTPNSQSNTEKEKQSWKKSDSLISGHITKLQSSKQHGTGTKTEVRSMDKIKTPEINPWTYSQLIYNTRSKIIQWRKDSFFNGVGKTGQLHKAGYYKSLWHKSQQYIFEPSPRVMEILSWWKS